MALQTVSLSVLGFNGRFLCLFAVTVLAASQTCVLNAGEKEALALAKLFPSELIAVQRIETGLSPEEMEFMNSISPRLEEAMKENPELMLLMKDHAELVKSGARSAGSMPQEVGEKFGLSAEEVTKMNSLSKGVFLVRRTGPIIYFLVQRENNALIFRRKQDVAAVPSDEATVTIERLLSNLKLRLDASDAQLLGVSIGPAEWIDTTQNKYGNMTGKGKGLQWSGVGLQSPKALNIARKQIKDTPLQATVWCMYKAEHKMTICAIQIAPEGAEDAASEKALFMIASAPAIPKK